MGWLRKKFRQLDKRIRKTFGKNAWLKVAALIAGTYIGMTGSLGGGATSVGGRAVGTSKAGQFFGNIGRSIKSVFWKSGTASTTGIPSVGVPGKAGHIPGTPAALATKGGLTWAGQTASTLGVNMLAGYGQAKLLEEPPRGHQVFAGSNEPSTIDVVQNAYNYYAGQPVNILEAYNDLDYGTASLRTAQNIVMGSTNPKQFIKITDRKT